MLGSRGSTVTLRELAVPAYAFLRFSLDTGISAIDFIIKMESMGAPNAVQAYVVVYSIVVGKCGHRAYGNAKS